jgi:hypothetical protein
LSTPTKIRADLRGASHACLQDCTKTAATGMINSNFLREYFRGTEGRVYLGALRNSKSLLRSGEVDRIVTRNLAAVTRFIARYDKPAFECGIYFCTATLYDGHESRTAEDCRQFPSLFADCDDHNHDLGRDRVIELLEGVACPPTLIINSGHGLQPHWLLVAPSEDAERVVAARKKLHALVASDAVHDAPRLMRVPGSHNSKGGDWLPVEVVSDHPERRYTLDQLEQWLASANVIIARKIKPKGNGADKPFTVPPPVGPATDHKRGAAWASKALEASARELAAAGEGSRHNTLRDKAVRMGTMVARGWIDMVEVRRALFAAAEACGQIKDDGRQHFEQTFADGIRYGMTIPHPDLRNDDVLPPATSPGDYGADNAAPPPPPGTSVRKPESIHSWDEPDISLLDDRRGELPDFPLEALCSEPLQDWVTRAAHGSGTSVAHVAVPLLGIASSLIGTARRGQASRSFIQPMTCWSALVGFSGSGKTPGIDATKRALAVLERNRKPKIADMQRTHEAKAEMAKIMRDKWKADLKAAIEAGGSQPPKPPGADDLDKFVTPRLFVSDATIEKIGVLLQARPQGMLMLADELAGLFLNMSRYTTGQDNEFWLECWNGNPYVIERMARPSIVLDYLLVGMVGGLQPDKLAAAFQGDQDGMYARMLFAWPDEPPYRPLTDLVGEVEPEIVNALDRLCALGGADELVIRTVSLTAESREVLEELRQHMAANKAALEGRERDWWAKLPAHVLRLAGTLCYLDWAMNGGPEPTAIGVDFMQAAVRLVRDYFWAHARAALRQIGLTEQHVNARRTLRWIRAAGLTEVSREDIRRDALAQALDADGTQALLDRLERAGWLRKMSKPTGPTGGRPAYRWEVNPQLIR